MKFIKKVIILSLTIQASWLTYDIIDSKYSFSLWGNIIMKEKTFISPSGKKIILLGMIHLANKNFYKEIENDYSNKEYTTLLEGVKGLSDKMNVQNGIYSKWGEYSNLTSQSNTIFKTRNKINADIHVDDLNPKMIDNLSILFLKANGLLKSVFSDIELTLEESEAYSTEFEFKKEEFEHELIYKRNDHLMSVIKENQDKNLLIPWGSLHLSDIENRLIKMGYKLEETNYRKALNLYSTATYMILTLI